jgi:uncharacterized protein (DUF2147 family)
MSRSFDWSPWRAEALGLALSFALGHGALAATALGEWLVAEGTARIKIIDCAGALWGIVSWESDPGVDSYNPDPAKRTQPITGTAILRGLKPSGTNRWDGTIYNTDNGRTYSGGITLSDANVLRVRGCILLVLCGGENWKRVEESVPASADLACEHVAPAQPSR